MSIATEEFPVVIVGAGPTGVTIANYLGQAGIRTLLVDQSHEIIEYPRAIGMDDESLRTFQSIGLADDVCTELIQNVPLMFFDAKKRCFAEMQPPKADYGWWPRNIFSQPCLERTLRRGLRRFDCVEVSLGTSLTSLQSHPDEVVLQLQGDSGEREVHAQYVVGADGGRSLVRQLVGIELKGETHANQWIVIDVKNDPMRDSFTGLYADPRRPYVCAHMPDGFRRWEFMVFDDEDAEAMMAPDRVRELLSHHVEDPDALEVMRARVYTHHSRVAEVFSKDRVFLAGDAAHLMPPWMGQGMNSGIRDANNLAWKLVAVLQGWAGPELLQTYEAERKPHATAMVDLSTLIGRFLGITNPRVARLRDWGLRAIGVNKLVKQWVLEMRFKPVPVYTGRLSTGTSALAGRRMIQPRVETSDQRVCLLDDVLGQRFALLGWYVDPWETLSTQEKEQLAALDISTVKVVESRPGSSEHLIAKGSPTTVVEDYDHQLRKWFASNQIEVALLRPDHYVCATGPAEDTPRLLRWLHRALDLPETANPAAPTPATTDAVATPQGESS